MNSDTVIRQLAEADAFAPELDLPESARPSSVALSQIRRSMNMDAKQLTRTPESKQRKQRGWLVALGAAAVVIVVAGLAIAFSRIGGETPPATTPSTTVSEFTPDQQAQIDAAIALIDVFNEGDVSAFSNRFQESAAFNDFAVSGSAVQRAIAFRMGIGEQVEVDECLPGTGVTFQDVVCSVRLTDNLRPDEAGPTDDRWVFGVSDSGKATMIRTSRSGGVSPQQSPLVIAMGEWMYREHRDVFDGTLAADCDTPAPQPTLDCVSAVTDDGVLLWGLSQEVAALLLDYREEFLASSTDF